MNYFDYYRSSISQRSNQSKREFEHTVADISENDVVTDNYHPWQSEYHTRVIREKNIKSMTKDPYTPIARLISHAIEGVTTEIECSPPLIPANAVTVKKINIKQAPRSSRKFTLSIFLKISIKVLPVPTTIRYLRRNELMPPERSTRPTSVKFSLLPQTQYIKPTIPVTNTNKITAIAPTLATTDRLLNRAKIRNDPSDIRRPPRKLILNASQETILPLSVYG